MARAELREHSSSLVPAGGLLQAVFDDSGAVIGYAPIPLDPNRRYVLMADRRTKPTTVSVANQFTGRAAATALRAPLATSRKAAETHRLAEQARLLAQPTVPPRAQVRHPLRSAHVQPVRTPRPARVVYVAAFGIRDPKAKRIDSERDREVLATIARARNGISRTDLLRALNATKRTGIVDGAVRRLRLAKAITTRIVTED